MLRFKSIFLYFTIMGTCFVLWSCQKTKPHGVIVVAIDDFSVDDIVCNQDQLESERSAWSILCQESVRFTHAYTTSTQSVPALASLLTGMYPFQHGLRFNSGQSLKVEIKTIPEEAIEKRWRTSFFSGGAPVFRKSGLHQGFEYFNDVWSVGPNEVYKPFLKSVAEFKAWLRDDVENSEFLSFFYVPDLAYLNSQTKSDFSEARNLSIESQMDQLDSTLFDLFKFIESQKRWQDTTIVVVGLHGRPELERSALSKGNNLHGENTQVGLFIKPRQTGAKPIQWTIDREVNLADLGKTIQEVITGNVAPSLSGTWPLYSFKRALEKPETDWPDDRSILIESLWDAWVDNSAWSRAAVISNRLLYLFEDSEKVYDLLVDREEVNPLKSTEYPIEKLSMIESELANIGFQFEKSQPKELLANQWKQKVLRIPYSSWLDPSESHQLMKQLNVLHKKDPQNSKLTSLVVHMALKNEDWKSLLSLALEIKDELLIKVAQNQFKKTNLASANKCFELASQKEPSRTEIKNCSDPLFTKYLLDRSRAEPLKEFERLFEISVLRETIRRYDLALQLRFDPQNLESTWPSLFEIYLALPENQKLKGQLFRRTQRKNQEEL